jgi:hypothetical protein
VRRGQTTLCESRHTLWRFDTDERRPKKDDDEEEEEEDDEEDEDEEGNQAEDPC